MYSTGITLLVILAAVTTLAMGAGGVALPRDMKAVTEPEPTDMPDLSTEKCPLPQVQNIYFQAGDTATGGRGEKGDTGPPGPPGPTAGGGATYIRWGRTTCNSSAGTQLVYSGRAAGSRFSEKGGGANYLCLPDDPEFLRYTDGVQHNRGYLYGTEYQAESSPPAFGSMHQHDAPCAVCYTPTRGTMIMIPAKTTCPPSWTREYYGYLMSADRTLQRSMFECFDNDVESVPGSAASTDPSLLYFVESRCNGIACPPYAEGRELACTVCTK